MVSGLQAQLDHPDLLAEKSPKEPTRRGEADLYPSLEERPVSGGEAAAPSRPSEESKEGQGSLKNTFKALKILDF